MKELSIEEKAKAYDEAIKRARKIKNGEPINVPDGTLIPDAIFPELKESEDEKMMNQLHSWMKEFGGAEEYTEKVYQWIKGLLEKQGEHAKFCDSIQVGDKVTRNKDGVLVNLSQLNRVAKKDEKQGEQKHAIEMKSAEESLGIDSETYNKIVDECIYGEQTPADKVEPKFKVGDWIVFNGLTLYIKEVVKGYYRTISKGGITNSYDWDIDNIARLWTIEDAKDGDVLFYDSICGFTFIYNGINPKGALLYSYVESNDGSPLLKYNIGKPNVGIGYVTDKNIYPATKEQRDRLEEAISDAGYTFDFDKKELKRIEQKPTNEEMKELLHTEYEKGRADAIVEMQEWSEEDEETLKDIITSMTNLKDSATSDALKDIYNSKIAWLKSLRPQINVTDEELAQAKKEAYNDTLDKIEYHSGEPTFDDGWGAAIWYLKKRNVQPQSHWKPSDGQMKALQEAIIEMGKSVSPCSIEEFHEIQSLYCDLKKLKEG